MYQPSLLLVTKDDKNQTMTFSGGLSRTKQNTYKRLKEFDDWGLIYQSLVKSCADVRFDEIVRSLINGKPCVKMAMHTIFCHMYY